MFAATCAAALPVAGCRDDSMSALTRRGPVCKVSVYSGGQVVREFTSSGNVMTEMYADGWHFTDKLTGKPVRVSGTIVVEQK